MTLPTQARRLTSVQTPVMGVVADLIQENPGTISLGQGVAHYGPPEGVIRPVQEFMATPLAHGYGYGIGKQELRDALRTKLKGENRIDGDVEVVVTAGSNMAFLQAILAITDPQDEVILFAPYYFNHEMAIGIADCLPVVIHLDGDFVPDVSTIEAHITPRTRAVVTVSPNNPTGVVYPPSLLKEINHLCRAHGIYHLSDEAYEYFTYDGSHHYSPGATAGASGHTISLFSLSKSYGMAGWRLGYMVLPANLLSAVSKIQDTNVICATLSSQRAAQAALDIGPAYCHQYLEGLDVVRKMVLDRLSGLGERVQIASAQGAFYVFLNLDTPMTSMEVCTRLIREHGVAIIPGSAFGHKNPSLRVSYGNVQQDQAAIALDRLRTGLAALLK